MPNAVDGRPRKILHAHLKKCYCVVHKWKVGKNKKDNQQYLKESLLLCSYMSKKLQN